jgi:excisionase family DNA binding protein
MVKSSTRDRNDPHRLSFGIQEWADLLGVSRQTVWRSIGRGEIRTVMIGRRKRIPASEKRRLEQSA